MEKVEPHDFSLQAFQNYRTPRAATVRVRQTLLLVVPFDFSVWCATVRRKHTEPVILIWGFENADREPTIGNVVDQLGCARIRVP